MILAPGAALLSTSPAPSGSDTAANTTTGKINITGINILDTTGITDPYHSFASRVMRNTSLDNIELLVDTVGDYKVRYNEKTGFLTFVKNDENNKTIIINIGIIFLIIKFTFLLN